MKKRFSPKQLLPSKKVIMAIAAAACVTAFSIGGVHYYNTNLKETATTATYYNQYLAASGADEVITDQVKDYISNYFQTMNVKEFISQDEMAQIIAQISTGVMNRLPTDTLSSGQELKVKEMISKAVIEAANGNNNQATDNTGADATVITEELQSYIKTTIVPNITAEIQINQGAIDDLKKSLADLSEKYKGNQKEYDALIDSISSKLGKLDKNGATNDDVANLKKDLEKLSKVLGDYKSSSSSDVTDVSKELEAAKKDLQSKIDKYTEVSDEQFTQIKDNLKESINQRDDLLADQKTQIINMIDSAQSDNVTSLADAKKELLKQINSVDASQSAALQDAIDDLTTGTITDLINTVAKNKNDQDQINVETDEKINDLTKVTSDQFDSMKTSLMDQINQNKQLSDADTGLIYLIFDVLLFLFSVTAIVAIAKNGVVSNNIVMNEVLEKNNIRQTLLEESYDGYLDNGKLKYDGVISGSQLVADLQEINGDVPVILIPYGGNQINLSALTIDGKYFMDYIKEVDASIATRNYIDVDSEYIRNYNFAPDGTIKEIIFKQN